jgi:hypothetical protein
MAHFQFDDFEIELMKDMISDRVTDHLASVRLALDNKEVELAQFLLDEVDLAFDLLRTVDLGGRGDGVEPAHVQACKSDQSAKGNRELTVNETKGALVPPVPLKLVPVQPVV